MSSSQKRNNNSHSGTLKARPFARLLTMIGDQLIKNDTTAIIELIKNSYDADASWVQVRFLNFGEEKGEIIKYSDSFIEIEDDGEGMTMDIILNSWMNPAAPAKFLQKGRGNRLTRGKKRLIQGEKGIGRYAVYKIGSTVELVTRSAEAPNQEVKLLSDLSGFDDEVISFRGKSKRDPLFLDEVEFQYERTSPEMIVEKEIFIRDTPVKRSPHGTLLRIRNLKGSWTRGKIDEIISNVSRLSIPFLNVRDEHDFLWDFQIDGKSVLPENDERNELERILDRAPIRVTDAKFNNRSNSFRFLLNGRNQEISVERLKGNKEFRSHFCDPKTGELKRKPECGSFEFQFYVFDLTSQASPKFLLDENDREFVKNHRIYLYRDEIRVYPYGDPTDDWLGIDILRGTGRAGDYLSNDQTIGYVRISGSGNPYLRDKTNREGLLEIGNAYSDFRILLQGFLGFLHKEYKKYKTSLRSQKTIRSYEENELSKEFNALIRRAESRKDAHGKKLLLSLLRKYEEEKRYLSERARITEDLAAVGLTVEAASHDLMMMMNRAVSNLQHVIAMVARDPLPRESVFKKLETLRGQLDFISHNIEGIQPIFRSSKRGILSIDVRKAVQDARKYYEEVLEKNSIQCEIEQVGPPLKIRASEGVLLQTFINLIDNSVYWLQTVDRKKKEIRIIINSKRTQVIFADNGPGVDEDDLPYIFEPFFSTKGFGRGLGLYIARQLLERHDFAIRLSTSRTYLPGANFILSFTKKGAERNE